MDRELKFALYYFILGIITGVAIFAVLFAIQNTLEANTQTTITATVLPNICNANLDVIHACCESVK